MRWACDVAFYLGGSSTKALLTLGWCAVRAENWGPSGALVQHWPPYLRISTHSPHEQNMHQRDAVPQGSDSHHEDIPAFCAVGARWQAAVIHGVPTQVAVSVLQSPLQTVDSPTPPT